MMKKIPVLVFIVVMANSAGCYYDIVAVVRKNAIKACNARLWNPDELQSNNTSGNEGYESRKGGKNYE